MTAKSIGMSATGEAKRLVNELLRMEVRCPGDLPAAMRRLGNRYGLDWRVFWNLRYRPPEDVFVGVFEKLKAAYRAECVRQLNRLQHDLKLAEASGTDVGDLKTAAETLMAALHAKH